MKLDRARRFAETTTIHGLKDFLRIDYVWARFIWVLFVITCLTMMIYETYALLIHYLDEPTATQVKQKYLSSYPYPRIIFCPRQWINESKVMELNLSRPLLIYALSLLRRVRLHKKDSDSIAPHLDRLRNEFDAFLKRHKFGSHLKFFSEIANNPLAVSHCDQCEITGNQVVASGVCIQFKPSSATSDQLIKLSPTFRYRDLSSDSGSPNAIPGYFKYFDSDSIYVSFKPQYDFFAYDPIPLNRNNSYVLRIKPTNYQRLDKNDRPCATVEEMVNAKYSQVMCYFNCDERYKSTCRGCTYLTYELKQEMRNSTLPYCSSVNRSLIDDSCAELSHIKYTKCIQSCEPLCNEWVYETTAVPVAQRKLITSHEDADITINLSYQVRYGETFIEEVQTYSWQTFVSNIGGQLGLWMGASVVSVLQLIHFVIEFIYFDLNPFRRLTKIAPNSPTGPCPSIHISPPQEPPSNAQVSTSVRMSDWNDRLAIGSENTRQIRPRAATYSCSQNGANRSLSLHEL